jgi:serine/threonine-protein kinase
MKLCTQCDTGFPDQVVTCPTHGGVLGEIRELKPGMLIHKTYRIVRKLGQGGMGVVYLADHVFMEEQRALKFLSAGLSQDSGFTHRFRREVRTLKQIRHKNVVECGDLEPAEDDSLFFAMEYVSGSDLRSFLDESPRPFPVPLALAIARDIAGGLGAAHALGMVHRDIKPENILMASEGDQWVPKITDFGIVATKESDSSKTRTGASLLTLAYAAPEQWRGMRAAELDGRTDLYALGGVLFEMLTGQTVFDAENYEGWSYQHQRVVARSASSVRGDLANWRGLDALLLRLLAKDRNNRPRDVEDFLRQLAAVHYVAPKAGGKRKEMPRWARAAAIASLVAIGSVTGLLLRPGHKPPVPPTPATIIQPTQATAPSPTPDPASAPPPKQSETDNGSLLASSVAATAWDGKDVDGTHIKFEFLRNGTLRYTMPSGTFSDGTWKQTGSDIYMEMNGKYAEYHGKVSGTHMSGNASNISGLKWDWSVEETGLDIH